jgi:hypothetical protein
MLTLEEAMPDHRDRGRSDPRVHRGLFLLLAGSLGLAACDIFESSDPFAKLEVDSSVELTADGDTVVYTLSVWNPSSRDLTLIGGTGHEIFLEVHALRAEGGGVLWENRNCCANIGSLSGYTLLAGGDVTHTLQRKLPVSIILGDSIPPGRYELLVRPNFDQRIPEEGLMPVELTLGGSPGAAVARLNQGARRSP